MGYLSVAYPSEATGAYVAAAKDLHDDYLFVVIDLYFNLDIWKNKSGIIDARI